MLLTRQQVKFEWTPLHHAAFLTLKEAIIQAPILHCPDPNKRYIIYRDASNDACGAQLSQEHDSMEFPIAFISHTFTETQRKWSTIKQEAYGVYYAVTKWNHYLQGADIIVQNDHKPLAKFLNGKNASNKVNQWGLELATYNITFEWQMPHLMLHQTQLQCLKPSQWTGWKLFFGCRKLIHSANAYQNIYQMVKCHNTKTDLLYSHQGIIILSM